MFGLQQACTEKVKFCSDGLSGLQKIEICSDWLIRPQKAAILFGLASKMVNLLSDGQFVELQNPKWNHSTSISSALLAAARPFLQAATRALTALKISWSFPRSSFKIWNCASSRVSARPSWLSVGGGVAVRARRNQSDGSRAYVPTCRCSIAIHWCTVRKLRWYAYL